MIRANKEQLKTINERYNEIRDDISVGIDYLGEGCEIIDFIVDDNGRTTIAVCFQYLNRQYAIRFKHFERHPKLKMNEINYLLGEVEAVWN